MRSFEYGMHCIRKHLSGITEWIVEVLAKLATFYTKLDERLESGKIDKETYDKIKREIIEDIKILSFYRMTFKALMEKAITFEPKDLQEAYDFLLNLMSIVREFRSWLDQRSLYWYREWVKYGLEPAIIDEVREAVGNSPCIDGHIADTFENILKEVEIEKKEEAQSQ